MTIHHADLEFFTGGIARVFADGAGYGDPYEYSLAFKRVDDHTIEMVGVFSNDRQNNLPLPHQWRAIKQAADELGITILCGRKSGANPGTHVI